MIREFWRLRTLGATGTTDPAGREASKVDAVLADLRRREIEKREIPISNENLRKILKIYLIRDGLLCLKTIDGEIEIEMPKEEGGRWADISPTATMYNSTHEHDINTRIKITRAEKEEFLKAFPVSKLYAAFWAADKELENIKAKEVAGKI